MILLLINMLVIINCIVNIVDKDIPLKPMITEHVLKTYAKIHYVINALSMESVLAALLINPIIS
jgi:hypothetical protein